MKKRNKPNWKVVSYSLVGLVCVALTFLVHWAFILGVAIVLWLNQKELMGDK